VNEKSKDGETPEQVEDLQNHASELDNTQKSEDQECTIEALGY
jgi:hypothetical protein